MKPVLIRRTNCRNLPPQGQTSMSATDILREDHTQIRRLERVIHACQKRLYLGDDIPLDDIWKITVLISDFLDAIHYAREEDSYFACVASYGTLKDEIRKFMIEHEFGRRIARGISLHLRQWRQGRNSREPVARFLRTYSIYLKDHLDKEDAFFEASRQTLAPEEEEAMYAQFQSMAAAPAKMNDLMQHIRYLESRTWYELGK